MPVGALPVSGVSIGVTLRCGAFSTANAAATVAPLSLTSMSFGGLAIFFDGQNGAAVNFTFTEPFSAASPLNTPFLFGGSIVTTQVTLADSSRFGSARAVKAAKDFMPNGVAPPINRGPLVWHFVEGGGAGLDFPFDSLYEASSALNTAFVFGGANLITAVGIPQQNTTAFNLSSSVVNSAFGVYPTGLNKAVVSSRLKVWHKTENGGAAIDFSFDVDVLELPSPLNIPFYFGYITATGSLGALQSFGLALIYNSAKSFTPAPVDSLRVGRPKSYYAAANGANVDFSFMAPYAGKDPRNVPFYFAGLLRPNPVGFDATQYGTFTIESNRRFFPWVSIPPVANQVGVPTIRLGQWYVYFNGKGPLCTTVNPPLRVWNLRQVLKAPSPVFTVFGQTAFILGTPQLKPATFVATEYGLPSLENVSTTMPINGKLHTVFGQHNFKLWRSIYQFHGFDSLVFGAFTYKLGTPQITPASILPFRYGYFDIVLAGRAITFLSFTWLSFGTPHVELRSPSKTPVGIYGTEFGLPTIENKSQSFKPVSIRSLVFSIEMRVKLGARNFTPHPFCVTQIGRASLSLAGLSVSGTHVLAFGNTRLSIFWHGVPSIDVKGRELTEWGQIRVVSSLWVIAPETFNDTEFGKIVCVNGNTLVYKGTDFFVSGKPEVTKKSLSFTPLGFDLNQFFGKPSIENGTPIVTPETFTGMWFGNAVVKNAAQAIYLVPIANLKFGKFYPWAVTQETGPSSINQLTIGAHYVWLKTFTVSPRYMYLLEFGSTTRIWNKARLVRPTMPILTVFGNTKLELRNRTLTCYGVYGTQFGGGTRLLKGPAPEKIKPASISQLLVNAPTVWLEDIAMPELGIGYTFGAGLATVWNWATRVKFGNLASLTFEKNINIHNMADAVAVLAWPETTGFGVFEVVHGNPSKLPLPWDSLCFGDADIVLAAQAVVVNNIADNVFGGHDVRWGQQFVTRAWIKPPPASVNHKVVNTRRYFPFANIFSWSAGTFAIYWGNPSRVMSGVFDPGFGDVILTLAARAVKVESFMDPTYGTPHVMNVTLFPSSIGFDDYGRPEIALANPGVVPRGINSLRIDPAYIRNFVLYIAPRGLSGITQFGKFEFTKYPIYVKPKWNLIDVYGKFFVEVDEEFIPEPNKIEVHSIKDNMYGFANIYNALKGAFAGDIHTLKFGNARLELSADALVPKGIYEQRFSTTAVIYLNARLVGPKTFTCLEFNTFEVGSNSGWVGPYGFTNTRWGGFETEYKLGILQVSGFQREWFGTTKLWLLDQHLKFFSEFPKPLTQWGEETDIHIAETQKVIKATIKKSEVFGNPSVTYLDRRVEQHDPHLGAFVGRPAISHFLQRIDVPWMGAVNIGRPVVHRFTPIITEGRDYLEFGKAVQTFGNMLYPVGFTDMQKGDAWVSHSPRFIKYTQRVTDSTFSEKTKVFNSRQYIEFFNQVEYMTEYMFGTPWFVNQFKEIIVPGISSMRFKTQFDGVYNKGRLITHPGLDATQWMTKKGFIAHRVRYVNAYGMDGLYAPRGTRIHNAAFAFVLRQGIDALVFSKYANKVVNTRRFVLQHTGSVTAFGTAFIAYARRWLHQIRNNSDCSAYGKPAIGLAYWVVEPPGIEPPPPGLLVASGPFRRGFTPRWPMANMDHFGLFRIKNFNPQAWPPGRPYFEMSPLHWVSHAPRTLDVAGFSTQMIVKFSIRDRRTFVYADGIHAWMFDRFSRVAKTTPDPLPVPKVDFTGFGIGWSEIEEDDAYLGKPTVRYNMIMFDEWSELTFTRFGNFDTRAMGCFIRNPYVSLKFGDIMVSATQYMTGVGLKSELYGKPRISPYTIWCREDTPQQARENHPGVPFCPVDDECNCSGCPMGTIRNCLNDAKWPCWGRTTVTLQNRIIRHFHNQYSLTKPSSRFGEPELAGGRRWIYMPSIAKRGFGIAEFNPRTKRLMMIGPNWLGFGEHNVWTNSVVTMTYKWNSFSSLVFGKHNIELLHRRIKMGSTYKLVFGNNTPMVHFPRHVYSTTFDATKWGNTWVSFWIRSFPIEGFDSFISEWDRYKYRMIVSGGKGWDTWDNRIEPNTFRATKFGNHYVQFGIIHVYVYMIPPPCIPCCGHRVRVIE